VQAVQRHHFALCWHGKGGLRYLHDRGDQRRGGHRACDDQVIVSWTFTGSNTAGKMHKVDVTVWLVNEIGERAAQGLRRVVLSAGAKDQEFIVKVKTNPDDLEGITIVQVQANWTSS
jgi:hypothetical protein